MTGIGKKHRRGTIRGSKYTQDSYDATILGRMSESVALSYSFDPIKSSKLPLQPLFIHSILPSPLFSALCLIVGWLLFSSLADFRILSLCLSYLCISLMPLAAAIREYSNNPRRLVHSNLTIHCSLSGLC